MPHIPGHRLSALEQALADRTRDRVAEERPRAAPSRAPVPDSAPSGRRAQVIGDIPAQNRTGPFRAFQGLGEAFNRNILQPVQLFLDPFGEALATEFDRTTAKGNIIVAEQAINSGDPVRASQGTDILPQLQEELRKLDATRALETDFLTGRGNLSGPELAGKLRSQFQERPTIDQILFGAAADPTFFLPITKIPKVTRAISGARGARNVPSVTAPIQAALPPGARPLPIGSRGAPGAPIGTQAPFNPQAFDDPSVLAGALEREGFVDTLAPPPIRPVARTAQTLEGDIIIGGPTGATRTGARFRDSPALGGPTTREVIRPQAAEIRPVGQRTPKITGPSVEDVIRSPEPPVDAPSTKTPRSVTHDPVEGTTQVQPSSAEVEFLGLKPATVGLNIKQRAMNTIANMLGTRGRRPIRAATSIFGTGKAQADPVVNPIIDIAAEGLRRTESLANAQRVNARRIIDNAFTFSDDGEQIINRALVGVEGRRGVGPTLRTLAARLPVYWERLNTNQRRAMLQLKEMLENPRETFNTYPIRNTETGAIERGIPATAEDILEEGGGFYIPSGHAQAEQLGQPVRLVPPKGRPGSTATTAENRRVFTGTPDGPRSTLTQEEAIEQLGYNYGHPADTIANFITEAGRRASLRYVTDSLAPYTMTVKQVAEKLDPGLFSEMRSIRRQFQRLRTLGFNLSNSKAAKLEAFFEDPTFDDINVVFDAINTPIKRGQFAGALRTQIDSLKAATMQRMTALRPSYNRLMARAAKVEKVDGQDIGRISADLNPLMSQRRLPFAMADAAEDQLKRLVGGGGRFPVFDDLNSLYTGAKATGDDSFTLIQALAGLYDNPIRWAKVFKAHFRGFFDLNTLGARIESKNNLAFRTVKIGGTSHIMPTVESLITRAGLRIQGMGSVARVVRGEAGGIGDTVFTAGRGRNPFVRLNNLFTSFGDHLRLETIYDDIAEELHRGRNIDDLWRSGDMEGMAQASNVSTGFADSTFAGPAGKKLLFAGRWLQARMEMTIKGAAAIRDPRILVETLPGGARLTTASSLTVKQRRMGRRFWRTMGFATALTVGINEWAEQNPRAARQVGFEANPTYLQPFLNGRLNSNFMDVRWLKRDWSVYGPFISLFNLIGRSVAGQPLEAARGLTGGVVQNAWDFISIAAGQGDFRARSELGEKAAINLAEKLTGTRPDPNASKKIQVFGRLLENLMTFNTEDTAEAIEEIAEGDVVGGAAAITGEFFGANSTLLSPTDLANRHAQLDRLPTVDSAEPYQKRISFSYADVEGRREGFPISEKQFRIQKAYDKFDARAQELVTGHNAEGVQTIADDVSLRSRAFLYTQAETVLFAQLDALREFDTSKFPDPFASLNRGQIMTNEDALDAWYAITKLPSSINPTRGQPGGDPLEDNRQRFLSSNLLRPEQRLYVLRNTNLRRPPKSIEDNMSERRKVRIDRSEDARKRHLRFSIGANPELTESLRVLP